MPAGLLEQYDFWQNEDSEVVYGYLPRNQPANMVRSMLKLELLKKGNADETGFCNSFADAYITRMYLKETYPSTEDDLQKVNEVLKEESLPLVNFTESKNRGNLHIRL